jgi:phosphatidylglycerophosphate synthase
MLFRTQVPCKGQARHIIGPAVPAPCRQHRCKENTMLDARMRRIIDPPLDRAGRAIARRGVNADAMTANGLVLGLLAALCIVFGADLAALALLLACRICDGLDGAVARATHGTDRGGFIDIVADFIFYGAIPLAFALRDPASNALAAAALLFAFYVNGASFLAYAAMAARRGLESTAHGFKNLYFTTGLMEGTETIAFFVAMVLLPGWFVPLALLFAALTLVTAISRCIQAWTSLR